MLLLAVPYLHIQALPGLFSFPGFNYVEQLSIQYYFTKSFTMANISETQHSVSVATNVENEKDDRVQIGNDGVIVDHGLHRKLKQRHLQMIALGGVVGCVEDLCSSQPSQEHPLKLAAVQVFGTESGLRLHLQGRYLD